MNKITCIITDDEPFASKGLRGYVEKISFFELKGICEDAFQLDKLLEQQAVDLLFLDIQMPHISGIELIKTLAKPPKVIFTTAFEQYALQGFELDVIDYLLKPISFNRFLKAATKARDYFATREEKNNSAIPYIFAKTNGKLEKISFDEILFIEGMENYAAVYLENKKLIIRSTIKALLEKLPAWQFIQTHKSYIVAITRVDSIEGNTLHIGKYQVPISRYQRDEVIDKIIKG
ncbi:LytTR family DNA-binding domain-containing protein [Pedobacter sp.]|jgi:two-component system LytT family response regulator|uniref:LytR/AlgR family response regulator transcription factor n=1 Tax=Pedobacter sp. TaxID=1411316 RepID=UPI002BB0C892|nr:LytTR family DNA-binding domain-containing protein [Pedobacter sp.]HWW38523.1 LytTR family DNA-binding domain-containing protein [Pedobacter sp.]